MKDGNRKRAAEWILTAAVLAALAFAAGTAGIAQAALAREEAVTVALEGVCAGEEGYFQDTADAVITVHDRNFDRNSFAVTLRDGTDWEAEIGFTEEEGWTGASELPEKEIELTGWEENQDGSCSVRFRFAGEGDYALQDISCSDLAGNGMVLEEGGRLVVDRTAPVFEISLPEKEPRARDGYYSSPVTVWLYLKEKNFSPERGEQLPEVLLSSGDQAPEPESVLWNQAPEKGEDWYKGAVFCGGDAAWSLQVSYEDPAGRPLSGESRTTAAFTVDTTPPDHGSITAMGESWQSLLDHVTFGKFSMKAEPVILEGSDSVSPVEPLRYCCLDRALSAEELDGLGESVWKTGNSLLLEPDSRSVVYLKVVNYAGLCAYFNSDGLVLEQSGPSVRIQIQGEKDADRMVYRGDVAAEILIREDSDSGIHSGLRRADWRMETDGGTVREGTLFDMEEGTAEEVWQGSLEVPGELDGEETVTLTVRAEDFAGNSSQASSVFSIDGTAPDIQIRFDQDVPVNGFYYSAVRTARVEIREKHFSEEQVEFHIDSTEGAMPEISQWTHEGTLHRCTVFFRDDSSYRFSAACEDLAGRRSGTEEVQFVVDTTPPRVEITFEEAEAGTGSFYRTARTAGITVKERNFHGAGVSGTVAVTEDAEGVRQIRSMQEEFSGNGDTHRARIRFDQDGAYEWSLEITDLAGNSLERPFHTRFVIDQTAPRIQIRGVEDGSANRGQVSVRILCQDLRLRQENCGAELLKAEAGQWERAEQGMEERSSAGEREFLADDFSYGPETDGMYCLRVWAGDLAGNFEERQLLFSVNRYGSVYLAAEETARWLFPEDGSHPYLREGQEVVLEEYNVDAVDTYSLTLFHDGEMRVLREQEDFVRSRKTENGDSWQAWEYRVGRENFQEEGTYELLLVSEDAAGNKMGNSSAKEPGRETAVTFSVDRTAPEALITGAQSGGRYRTGEQRVILTVQENMALEWLKVCVGEEERVYEGALLAEEIGERGGSLELAVKESGGWQQISVSAGDRAGNQMEELQMEILVSSSILVQLMKTPAVPVLCLLGASASAGAAAVFVIRRRKRLKKTGRG